MACSKETLVSFGLSTQQTSKKREGKGTSHRGILLLKGFRLFHLSPYKMILEPRQQWMEGGQDHTLTRSAWLCTSLALCLKHGEDRLRGVAGILCLSSQCGHVEHSSYFLLLMSLF